MGTLDPARLSDAELAACLRELGRRSFARRVRVDRVCVECGRELTGVLPTRRTCGDACRKRRERRKKAPGKRADRRLRDPWVVLEERLRRKGWLPDVDRGAP